MKLLFRLVACCALLTAPAYAADFNACSVVQIVVVGDQNAHVQISCPVPISNVPACASVPSFIGFDKSTPAGKQYLSLLTYAHAIGGKVGGYVNPNSCSPWQTNVAWLTALIVSS